TDPNRTAPRGGHVVTLRKPVPCSPCEMRECPIDHCCMDWISLDEVYDSAVRELNAYVGK
ncbi:MAG: glycosyltransferase family 9 protein, partial [Nitrospiraceae bacterium]